MSNVGVDRMGQRTARLSDTPTVERSEAGDGCKTESSYAVLGYPGENQPLPDELARVVLQVEEFVRRPVCLLVQLAPQHPFGAIDGRVSRALMAADAAFPADKPVALIVHSTGGFARDAYVVARFLAKRCGRFDAIVPQMAKSAATLACLGAERILLGPYAELGPLDAQFDDPDREDYSSGLDEVGSLQQFHNTALELLDSTMALLVHRTQKRIGPLIPMATRFVTQLMRPVLEKIDAVHWSQTARALRVAEEYAKRLMRPRYSEADRIARKLVTAYPEHGFVIDSEEAVELGLQVEGIHAELMAMINRMFQLMVSNDLPVLIGRVQPAKGTCK